MSLASFRANLRHAISTRQTVSIGGGLFDTQDLEHVAARFARSDSDAGALELIYNALEPTRDQAAALGAPGASAAAVAFLGALVSFESTRDPVYLANAVIQAVEIEAVREVTAGQANRSDEAYSKEHDRAEANALEVVELREKLATAELERDRLQERNDAQATTIRTYSNRIGELTAVSNSYRGQRDAEGARAVKAELEAADCRTERDSLAARLTRSDARVTELQESNAKRAEALDLAERQAGEAEARLARLMKELGGLTLAQLPSGAYGGALADAYCDIKAGR